MPNPIAYLALMLWPLVSVLLFKRLPPERAVIWTILGAYLVLPPIAEFDLPLVPDMDKFSISSICAFACAVFILKDNVRIWPRSFLAAVLVLGYILVAIPTVLTNREPIVFEIMAQAAPIRFETGSLPGLRLIDMASVLSNQVIVLLPFLLGRFYLGSDKGLRELALAFAIGGLTYSLPALLEIRFSPQLNTWIYGFFQHSFAQMMRDGGFRPIVFLPHALWLALFMVTALVAAVALARNTQGQEQRRWMVAVVYLLVVLYLCKSLASQLYALGLVPVVFLAPQRWQALLAVVLAMIAISWPMLRNFGVIPLDAILAQAEAISPDRAHSLGYRFDNENALLQRAHEKDLFGWGGWGRNLVRHSETGEILSIPDGRWILTFGTFGWVGYLCEMGLLALPMLFLFTRMHKAGRSLSPFAAPLALILGVTMVDMLLNDTLVPIMWLLAGAVLGYAERLRLGPEEAPRPLFADGPVIGRGPRKPGRRTVL
ncbi:hypothetical protein [Roseovarius sp. MMSF_3281]|uniref:hypothetical protein n=1 Tax=Roseovarius sp. MMSF_3281 TaxID=3046694 RepID=UPI003531E84D